MVGMSYRQKPLPLLSKVNGKDRFALQKKVPDEAPPISSSDGESDTSPKSKGSLSARKDALKWQAEASDSDSDRGSRGEIIKTTFSATTAKSPRERLSRKATASTVLLKADESREKSPPATKRRRLDNLGTSSKTVAKSDYVSSSAEYLKDDQGFTKRNVVKQKYGQKYSSSQESQTRIVKVKSETQKQRSRLKAAPNVDDLNSPKKSGRANIQRPSEDTLSSPSKNSPIKTFKRPKDESDSSEDDSSSSHIQRPIMRQTATQNRSQKHRGNVWKGLPAAPKSPKLKFVKPAELSGSIHDSPGGNGDQPSKPNSPKSPHVPRPEISDLSDLSELSSLSDLELSEESQSMIRTLQQPAGEVAGKATTRCPWCGVNVSEILLKEFSEGKRLDVRMQRRFCRKHEKQSAVETWREKKYPTEILWADLKDRFDDHRPYLLKVIRGEPSHFRTILANKIETGEARNLKKERNLIPGYYGPRGFNIMCDYLVVEFGDLLKKMAVSDRVISGRGSAAFIESVLVAELAVRLIQEDMEVSIMEARNIMEESKAIGVLLNEEV
ncbi:RTC4-like domain-containing protein [Mariannaea sp. PMI_226]|nr:RTC4-like domain-containing protein [Mariannaea sp. PMI_226]